MRVSTERGVWGGRERMGEGENGGEWIERDRVCESAENERGWSGWEWKKLIRGLSSKTDDAQISSSIPQIFILKTLCTTVMYAPVKCKVEKIFARYPINR